MLAMFAGLPPDAFVIIYGGGGRFANELELLVTFEAAKAGPIPIAIIKILNNAIPFVRILTTDEFHCLYLSNY